MTDRTHWDGCWRDPGHHECAVARVEELRSEVRERLKEMNMEATKAFMAREASDRAEKRATTAERALAELRELLPEHSPFDMRDGTTCWCDYWPGEDGMHADNCQRLRAALAAGGDDGN